MEEVTLSVTPEELSQFPCPFESMKPNSTPTGETPSQTNPIKHKDRKSRKIHSLPKTPQVVCNNITTPILIHLDSFQDASMTRHVMLNKDPSKHSSIPFNSIETDPSMPFQPIEVTSVPPNIICIDALNPVQQGVINYYPTHSNNRENQLYIPAYIYADLLAGLAQQTDLVGLVDGHHSPSNRQTRRRNRRLRESRQ